MRYTLTVGLLVCMPTVATIDGPNGARRVPLYPASSSRPGPTGISFTTNRFPAGESGDFRAVSRSA